MTIVIVKRYSQEARRLAGNIKQTMIERTAVLLAMALLLIALLRKSPLDYGELSFPDGEPSATERTES